MRFAMLALLLAACGPKCLKEHCEIVHTTCQVPTVWVPTKIGNVDSGYWLYVSQPCDQEECRCVERAAE